MPDSSQGRGATPVAASAAELEAIAVEVARDAARRVRQNLGQARAVGVKTTPTDVVTATDIDVESAIRERLLTHTPGASVVGEEQATLDGDSRIGWIIDPIDGTVNFLYDLPVVGVSIAASLDGEVVAGAVSDVVRDEVFSSTAGGGARRDGVPINVTSASELATSLVTTGFSYSADRRAKEGLIVGRVLPRARDIRCFGSAALHLCWVACGRADAFYEYGLREWDVAAGALIAQEAGARVATASEGNLQLTLAASPHIFEELLSLVS